MKNNYYNILQCNPDDSIDTIKQNYFRLIKEHHPDIKQNNKLSEELVKELNEAYLVLSDPIRREEYNNLMNVFVKGEIVNPSTQVSKYVRKQSHTTLQIEEKITGNRSKIIIYYLSVFLSVYLVGRNVIDWGTMVKYIMYDAFSIIIFLFFTLLVFRKKLFGN